MSMSRNNPGVIIGLFIFVVFGFVFFIPRMSFIPFTIFPSFFIIILIVSIVATTSNNRKPNAKKVFKNENQVNTQRTNPYRVEYNPQKNVKTSQYQRVNEELELKPTIRFCQFCGTKIERDAMFCHNCGSKLDNDL
ncbi:MAG: zinc ribbon domain-containing protein [Promethearchaeota archaeon]